MIDVLSYLGVVIKFMGFRAKGLGSNSAAQHT